ncbi:MULTISPECIES: DHH family phosphoesterase [unclassified Clostridium]|uniref:DHH family phosphoesterase n=1 Tax=unclassified Clostridium TaxID=2614128 RepID=UPI0025C167F9|nr:MULTISPECIES: DHH family phosphoesterase [unclassified Clostridium]
MRFKAYHKGYEKLKEDELLDILLKQRGVQDTKRFLHVSEGDVLDGTLLKNMQEGLEMLDKHINNNSKILIIVDSDADGYTSSGLIYQYIKNIKSNIEVEFAIHKGKEHGIILKELESIDFNLLIVPDAGSNDIKECKKLKKLGKDILVLDHHICEKENPYAVVINCQDSSYPNNTLSGVGVTYKFCKEYDKAYNHNYADKYLDLVAIGMIADDMDLQSYETRYLVLKGLELANSDDGNEFLREIYKKREKDIEGNPTILNIIWCVAPLLNAVVRSGTMDEKANVFRALVGIQEEVEYQPRRKHKEDPKPPVEIHSLQETMARICVNIKSRQDKRVKEGLKKLQMKIEENKIGNNKIIVVDGTNDLDETFTGLVANKIADTYKRPSIILKEYNNILYGGSGRNYKLFEIDNLRSFLLETGLFNSISGHDNAFGFKLKKGNVNNLISLTNEKLKNTVIEDVYHVDYIIPVGRLREKDILQIGEWEEIWGNNVPEPLFAITGINITADNIQLLGARKNLIKIEKQIGSRVLSFTKFGNEEEYNRMIGKQQKGLGKRTNKRLEVEIVGKFKTNKWNNNVYPQIQIVDYNIKASKKFEF